MKIIITAIFSVFLGLLSSTIYAQENDPRIICDECLFLLNPLINVPLCLGTDKSEVLNNFDSYTLDTTDTFINQKRAVTYQVKKDINLPNNENVQLDGFLVFVDNELDLIEFNIPVSSDFLYLNSLKEAIQETDKKGLNRFIYLSKRNSNQEQSDLCTKRFLWRRSFKNPEIYELHLKYYRN
ncbi:hypothetical protein [Salinimicrobium sp. TH3]|uniref:hypothetical protein n=1 Tax=Salinimicrobium sp. TH3 TaxID=2997342 RepID=UPI0022751291|nr:hypothetical protein [Salinimicrobium sp. TH3]MCY2686785.1 hypothetical protein [Salinimicrobium sp. TH3]